MISPYFSPRGMFSNPYKNYVGHRSCFLAVFLRCEVVIERSELSCHTQDAKNATLLAASVPMFFQLHTANIPAASLPCRLEYGSGGRGMFQTGPRTAVVVSDPGREQCCSLLAQCWGEKTRLLMLVSCFFRCLLPQRWLSALHSL